MVAHEFAQEHNEDVDYRVMRTFTEFYTAVLSFTMYRLYTGANLKYPPIALDAEEAKGNSQQADMEALTMELRKT
jgi:pescadillo protein